MTLMAPRLLLRVQLHVVIGAKRRSILVNVELVTTSRNYAAFLISVVDRLLDCARDRKIYFVTSTPVAPFFLLNMPLRIGPHTHAHGRERFLDEYMRTKIIVRQHITVAIKSAATKYLEGVFNSMPNT